MIVLPPLNESLSVRVIHCMALAEILVLKFLSNGDGAPPCEDQRKHINQNFNITTFQNGYLYILCKIIQVISYAFMGSALFSYLFHSLFRKTEFSRAVIRHDRGRVFLSVYQVSLQKSFAAFSLNN